MTVPRGLLIGTIVAIALVWGVFALDTAAWPGIVGSIAQTALLLANLVLTARSPRTKVLIVRTLQQWTINPLMRLLLGIGINPLGLAILETRGRVSGQPRRTPVGNGREGNTFWIIAEHGTRAGYVRNIQRDPRVRVRLRIGWRLRWVPGIAEILPDDDALARQRRIIRWHPLRAFNAMNVRVLGTDLLTVRVQLLPELTRRTPRSADAGGAGQQPAVSVHRARVPGVDVHSRGPRSCSSAAATSDPSP
ncbi:MAG TPA: nitroreductase/quinone reductase family protein [Pseudonocardiaceae bacterium]